MSITLQDIMNGNDGDSQSTKEQTETLPQPNCSGVSVGNGLVNVNNEPQWVSNGVSIQPIMIQDTLHFSLNDLLTTFQYVNITKLGGLDTKINMIDFVTMLEHNIIKGD